MPLTTSNPIRQLLLCLAAEQAESVTMPGFTMFCPRCTRGLRDGWIEKLACELAGHALLAAGYLTERLAKKTLIASTPEMLAAMKQSPENSIIV